MEQQSFVIPEDVGITTVELVTPEMAKGWLIHNIHNRNLNERWVAELARRMSAGLWSITHQGIAFAKDGTLIDGQHRLAAIVRCGKAILIRVTRGLPRDVQWDIDGPKIRQVGDNISIYEKRVGAAGETRRGKDKQAISSVLADFIEGAHSDTLNDSLNTLKPFSAGIDFVLNCGFKVAKSTAPVRAAVAVAYGIDSAKVSAFYECVLSGVGLQADSPARALREVVERGYRSTRARSTYALKRHLFLCTCNAAVAHMDGQSMKTCRPSLIAVETLLGYYGLKSKVREAA